MQKAFAWLMPLSILVAWLFDFLFWDKGVGISFAVFVIVALATGFYLARRQGLTPARRSLWLLLPVAFFLVVGILRLEPFTLFLCRAITLLCMALLAASFLGGRWVQYSLLDYVAKLLGLVPLGLFKRAAHQRELPAAERTGKDWRRALPILRGLLLALPLLFVLGSLLASADPIFGDWLDDVLAFLNLEYLGEYLWRAVYIGMLAYILAGVYFYALQASRDETLLGEEKALLAPFLGFAEIATVLVSVEVLFLAFVAVQFRYFFGGEANVNAAGFTFAEYARRGFGEVVFVAFIALLLFMLLSSIGRRESHPQQRAFSGLGVALMALVSVMLVSAFQRLLLYEAAYGFTLVRTYSHVFMIWLGLLLLAVVLLELLGRRRAFALAMLGACLGFAASLALLNVDAFIVSANLERVRQGEDLDIAYLRQLSEDALPALAAAFQQSTAQGAEQVQVLAAAAMLCHADRLQGYAAPIAWQAFHLSRWRAAQAWEQIQAHPDFIGLDAQFDEVARDERVVIVAGERFTCW